MSCISIGLVVVVVLMVVGFMRKKTSRHDDFQDKKRGRQEAVLSSWYGRS